MPLPLASPIATEVDAAPSAVLIGSDGHCYNSAVCPPHHLLAPPLYNTATNESVKLIRAEESKLCYLTELQLTVKTTL